MPDNVIHQANKSVIFMTSLEMLVDNNSCGLLYIRILSTVESWYQTPLYTKERTNYFAHLSQMWKDKAVATMGTWIICLSSCLSLFFLMILIKFFNKLWWAPTRLQSLMRSQGIKGPPNKFRHGRTQEIINMGNEVMISPMELSHHVKGQSRCTRLPVLQDLRCSLLFMGSLCPTKFLW